MHFPSGGTSTDGLPSKVVNFSKCNWTTKCSVAVLIKLLVI